MMGGAWYDQVLGDKTQEEVGRLAVEQVRQQSTPNNKFVLSQTLSQTETLLKRIFLKYSIMSPCNSFPFLTYDTMLCYFISSHALLDKKP